MKAILQKLNNSSVWTRLAYLAGAMALFYVSYIVWKNLDVMVSTYVNCEWGINCEQEIRQFSIISINYFILLSTGTWLLINGVFGRFIFKRLFFCLMSAVILFTMTYFVVHSYDEGKEISSIEWGFDYYAVFAPFGDDYAWIEKSPDGHTLISKSKWGLDEKIIGSPLPFEKAGLKLGDKILTVFELEHNKSNARQIFRRFLRWQTSGKMDSIPISVERDGKTINIQLPPNTSFNFINYYNIYHNKSLFRLIVHYLVSLAFIGVGLLVIL